MYTIQEFVLMYLRDLVLLQVYGLSTLRARQHLLQLLIQQGPLLCHLIVLREQSLCASGARATEMIAEAISTPYRWRAVCIRQ